MNTSYVISSFDYSLIIFKHALNKKKAVLMAISFVMLILSIYYFTFSTNKTQASLYLLVWLLNLYASSVSQLEAIYYYLKRNFNNIDNIIIYIDRNELKIKIGAIEDTININTIKCLSSSNNYLIYTLPKDIKRVTKLLGRYLIIPKEYHNLILEM